MGNCRSTQDDCPPPQNKATINVHVTICCNIARVTVNGRLIKPTDLPSVLESLIRESNDKDTI
jgi:hypothetical protein